MIKLGIIGLGSIAQKAYLPVMAEKKVEVHLCSRSKQKLTDLGAQYRYTNLHVDIKSLIAGGIQAAFVHTATSAHEAIIEELLNNNIHVYVDKPITYHAASSERLLKLASKNRVLLQVGFNRRLAPAYHALKRSENINMIVMEKNRKSLPGDIRTFVFDDFIHVIDTLLFLHPEKNYELNVNSRVVNKQLYHIVMQLTGASGCTAIGIMNRDSGTVEERLEVFTPSEKITISDLVRRTTAKDGIMIGSEPGDWETTLKKRGFESMIEDFLASVTDPNPVRFQGEFMATHLLAEKIVQLVESRAQTS